MAERQTARRLVDYLDYYGMSIDYCSMSVGTAKVRVHAS